ncbi:malto-oligosyltrehalose synthase [Agrococcus sp. SGAir0287]|uniref:malto-oligosyltrehalose synthase n=1 Tax=Agrococcus sp. SGAir0287 TaxID=2070347 RepID=UPI0010CCE7C2|nr:malto-oligosyltrehalose synthase [Agrococcus sp. SGAir0287]QCR20184.1 malto-oligosyltrehalose synthase [Agrococcus sp. SGAir0287]
MRVPTSTYRLQVTAEQTLHDAAARLEALHDLGVDWVYLSPILAAEPGSSHGYDVVAHDRVDPERGGAEGLAALSAEARRLGMGVLVDIVPNHVGVATPEQNAWWWDVLRLGRDSPHADAFDVDWSQHDGRILLPIVGDDDDLGGGRVDHLSIDGDVLRYWDTSLPIAPGTARQGDDANAVLARQHYVLGHWRRGDDELAYRRFFAVTTLAAIRVEDRAVFDASHAEIRRWFDEGLVDGLRVDHPDGLRDPEGYLRDLADLSGGAYVLVEKILEPGEELPAWPTAGTTGYDALALVDRVLTDPAAEQALDAIDARLRGLPTDWHALIHATKRGIADSILRAEVLRLEREVRAEHEDAPSDVADALAELLACFPVYRSYLPEGAEHLQHAADLSAHWRPDLAETVAWLLPILLEPSEPAARRFQQTSGMVMAKGVEDTAFYRYARLTSLNEVGGDPSVFAITPGDFHAAMTRRQQAWPHAMTTLSTHDTKRGEDVRARIATIAEVPHEWDALLERMLAHAPRHDRSFSSLLLQAVVGAWPASPDRLHAYAEKAAREADARTHWTAPDEAYEGELAAFVDACLAGEGRAAIEAFVDAVDAGWRSNVLSAKLLALAMPGVPDVYQGSEVRELSLVDPDNRRPIDWDEADALRARAASHPAHVDDLEHAKVRLVRETLRLRRDRPELLTGYAPVQAHGAAAEHALAFDRGGAVAVVTRLPLSLARRGGWRDTTIPLAEGRWRELLSGREHHGGAVRLADLLRDLPVALLVRADA